MSSHPHPDDRPRDGGDRRRSDPAAEDAPGSPVAGHRMLRARGFDLISETPSLAGSSAGQGEGGPAKGKPAGPVPGRVK